MDSCLGEQGAISAVYPQTITYANGNYQIWFDRGSLPNRGDYPSEWERSGSFHAFEKYRLNNIYVLQDLDGNGVVNGVFETVIRRYKLEYAADTDADIIFPGASWTAGGKTTTLRSVTQYGTDGTTTLPAVTFTYGDKLHLTQATNGYGGTTYFWYELWYYATDARPSNTIFVDFGASGYPCHGDDPGPFYALSGAVDCGDNDGDPLFIRGPVGTAYAESIQNHVSSSYQNPSKDLVRPGGVYKLTAEIGLKPAMSARLGLFYGTAYRWEDSSSQTGIRTAYITLPADASKAGVAIEETGGNYDEHPVYERAATVGNYKFQLLTSIYRVQTKGVQDEVGNYYKTVYSYTDNSNVDTGAVNTIGGYTEVYSEFRGHSQVTQTDYSWNGSSFVTHGTTVTNFYQDDLYKGRPSVETKKDGSLKLSQVNYIYSSVSLDCAMCATYGGPYRNWIRTDAVTNTLYKANGVDYTCTKTFYTYESNYGNLIRQEEKEWNGSAWALYRTTTTDYFPNATEYLVGFPAVEQVKDASGTVLAAAVNTYDLNTSYASPPTAGKLAAVRTWVEGAGATVKYGLVTYGYDTWGNRTTVTAYKDYTDATTVPTTGTQTTTTAYDGIFHVYPTSQTTPATQYAPAGLTTAWKYDYDNNGTDDFILGVPTRETDPNGQQTSAFYDVFGRMTKLIRPGNGDTATSPTIAIQYNPDTVYSPGESFWTKIHQRLDGSRYATIARYYDGLGRQKEIEKGHSTLSAGTFAFTRESTVFYEYPLLDTVKGSTPHVGTEAYWYTTTVSDVLGRPKTITAPNGNIISYSYSGLETTVTDAKGNRTVTRNDVWGRVAEVEQQDATPQHNVVDPKVTYEYDELDRLTTAARGGATTKIKYDNAGRKIGMDDPDMGMAGDLTDDLWGWTYTYNAIGNLTLQKDARGQRICLYYDSLNRLMGKQYRTDDNCPTTNLTLDVSYVYDQGTNGKGRRTSMTDGSGSTSWSYDVRGRVTGETVNAGTAYTTQWTYNSADLPQTMVYPDTETLTYTYQDNGLLDTVTSSLGDTYLADTQYDPAGRITSMDYGVSVLRKTFNYYAWDTAIHGGQLQSLKVGTLSDPTSLQNLEYAYDAAGNVDWIKDWKAGNPQLQDFDYDALNRLTGAAVTGGMDGLYNETYTYNPTTGNLASKAGVNYEYDTTHAHAVGSLSNGNTYQYDANGNMTDRNLGALTFDLAYDAENRLVSVTSSGTPPTATPTSIPPTATASATPSQTPSVTPTITATQTPSATNTPGGPTPTHTPTPTITDTPTPTNTPGGATVTFTPTPTVSSDLIFADGFESGNLSAWTSSSTDGGDLSVSTAAALHGSNGLQAVIDDTNAIYLTDDTPNAEPRYRARFYFDPNSLTMANNDAHFNFKGFQGTSTEVVRVEFRNSSGAYQVRAALLDDGSTWVNTNWFTITDTSHYLEVDWRAATTAGANDGGITLWIDGTQQADLTGMDNDTWRVDRARIGALSSLDVGTSGTYYFDAFESRRSNYIGPMALAPFHFALPKSIGTIVSGAAGRVGGALPPYRDHFASYNFSLPQQQGGTLTFTPADDAYIANGSPTSNYGSATTLQVDNSPIKHFLLKFDVTGVNGQTISNAKIRLYNVNAANAGGNFYHVTDDSWQEETATWNNAPTADTQLLASLGSVSVNTWYEVDVTSLVTGDGTYSIRISDSTGGADYSSKEGANDPELVLTLGGTPGPTNTPTNTPTPGPSPTPTNTPIATPIVTNTPTPTAPVPFNHATFVYDGDGKRVKSIFNGTTTTYFVGAHYEVTGSTITKYYYAGSQRIAMRTNGTLRYILTDHLGSTSLTTDANGQNITETYYKAWGEVRYASDVSPTKYQYTGQYSDSYINLLDYGSRRYDPELGRFIQPDSIVPLASQGVQAWDRFGYANNNPIRYTDPTGHCIDGISTWVCLGIVLTVATVAVTSDVPHSVTPFMETTAATTTDANALIAAFTTDTLPNQTASGRLETILESTSSIAGNFDGDFGESGFMTELQDGYLYDQYWGGSTDQVGHFLTAVNGGYNVAQGQLSQDVTLRFFLGHEKIGDQNGPWQQYGAASAEDIDLFLLAIGADAAGNYDLRDEYLMRILGSGSLAGRTGNSLEDLRLTLRGWRFGQMIANGKIKTREDAAIWLQENIGQ